MALIPLARFPQIPISLLVCSLFIFPQTSPSQESSPPRAWWVFFRDRGPNAEQRLEQLGREWNSRSLSRRAKHGGGLSVDDLPLWEEYIQEIEAKGAIVRTVSQWFNAISIWADSFLIARISKLPTVAKIEPVSPLNLSRVEGTEEVKLGSSSSATPGDYGLSYHQLELCRIPPVHQSGYWGQGVLIGLLDTGFSLKHSAFARINLVAHYDFAHQVSDFTLPSGNDLTHQADHGTACLSVLAGYAPGYLIGVAPLASYALVTIERTDREDQVEEDWWVRGLEWLESIGADVVSSSVIYQKWYAPDDLDGRTSLVCRAVERAFQLGVIVVNAAGNNGPQPRSLGTPSDAPEALAVGAVDFKGKVMPFSSRGPTADGRIKPDVVAPGHRVVCVDPDREDGFTRWNGTSLATPIVAGICALILQAHPQWTASRVIEAVKMTASRAYAPDENAGYGIPDALSALKWREPERGE